MYEEVPHHMLVSDKEDEYQYKENVEYEGQRDAKKETTEKGSFLDAFVGEVERKDKTIDTVGSQNDRAYEAEGEQRGVLVAHHVVDGLADNGIEFVRHDAVEAGKKFALDASQGQEGHEGEDENQQRRHGSDERIGQGFSTLGKRNAERVHEEIAEYIIDRHTLVTWKRDVMKFEKQITHPPLVQKMAHYLAHLYSRGASQDRGVLDSFHSLS